MTYEILIHPALDRHTELILGGNAYNQPAVEPANNATFGLMGRRGFEEWERAVDGVLDDSGRVI